ncbi:hypothetical protein [Myroides sp. WP-1]|uniref:hypothetical protein n=1 Tax=Myroides sp. WP-1 TaxID=2759944 RepID=UPI0015FB7A92|nr:hypothetical protein [Myroides sp. WP-1]MBB1140423.1 hypothetical protein [Myroides sp. WP-1]
MNFIKSLPIILILVLFSSCGPKQLTLNKVDYHAHNNVAVIIHQPTTYVGKGGSQGLLDMAVTPQTKYKEAVQLLSEAYTSNIHNSIKEECQKIYDYTGKKYLILDSIATLPTTNIGKKEVIDYQYIKEKYKVDQVQEIWCTYGVMINYYGFIETDKYIFVSIDSVISDIERQQKLQQYNKQNKVKLKGKWQKNDYAIFKESLNNNIKLSLREFNSQF